MYGWSGKSNIGVTQNSEKDHKVSCYSFCFFRGGPDSLGLNSSTFVDAHLFCNIVTCPDGSPLHFCDISCRKKGGSFF